jgi:nucleoside-specific outer membrane channel protein Tsx
MFEEDEALGLITLYMEPDLVHHTNNKSAKQVWDAFHTLFGTITPLKSIDLR